VKIRVNILSGARGVKLDWITGLSGVVVQVFHTSLPASQAIGTASGYEIEGEDLWATLDLEEGFPHFDRAAGLLEFGQSGARLRAVIVTTLPKEIFAHLLASMGRPSQ
jgi:hypothetical protein